MKILITGANGQLGQDVAAACQARGHTVFGTDRDTMDITDRAAVLQTVDTLHPDCILHCAAWTAVDLAEDEPEKCRAVNVLGTQNIVAACQKQGCKLLYLSTDYVFNGTGTRPWSPNDPCAPLNVYGQTKFAGEQAVATLEKYFIVRIAWVFGKNGGNFVKTMLRLAETRSEISVVCDQVGAPTYTKDLARLLTDMAESSKYGIYHATNTGGFCSWYDFAKEIFRCAKMDVRVLPVSAAQYAAKAPRPQNSRMDQSKLVQNGFAPLPPWQDAVARFLKEIGE